ncbi:hypothetical protein DCAR_0728514 [Daucus carota subsp. sativus]|uniref:Uncharacterized protein n=1 Tax=Daucus carota subsp. sativus TaxID=79200 RepID=A0AAF0XM90_DAUCS|nr:hypothetical protein DCAR_0728514 [Daucus carota subsp. sativus]
MANLDGDDDLKTLYVSKMSSNGTSQSSWVCKCKIYKCEDDGCPRPMYAPMCDVPDFKNTRMKLLRHTMIKQLPDNNELELPRTICMLAEKL